MARSRDRRGSQRSEWSDEFRDDFEEPSFFRQQPAGSTAPGVDAVVLWFNAEKGFGFVETPDGKAFLHMRQLEAAGYTTVSEGTPIKVVIQPGDKGPHVVEIQDVGPAPKEQTALKGPADDRQLNVDIAGEVQGLVKFYNSDKGFGFIGLNDGTKDIFVHASTLSRSGIASLEQGQAVWVQYAQGTKGPEARSVRLD